MPARDNSTCRTPRAGFAIWLYHRFNLSSRDIEDLMAERGIGVRERGMRRFKSMHQAQRFLSTHAVVYNLFNLGRHLVSAEHYRFFRARSLPLGCNGPLRLGNVRRPYK
jgi:transposase-like protein